MSGVRTPMIGIKTGESEGLAQGFALQKDVVSAAPKAICQDGPCVMMLGKDKAQYLAACFLILPV